MERWGKKKGITLVITLLLSVILLSEPANGAGLTLSEKLRPAAEYGVRFEYEVKDDYSSWLSSCEEKGYVPASETEAFTVPGGRFLKAEEGARPTREGSYENALLWPEESEHVEWELDVSSDGLYMLAVSFRAVDEKAPDMVRRLTVDGEIPYSECGNIRFRRQWTDEAGGGPNPLVTKRPGVRQLCDWQTVEIYDADRMFEQPLQFYLTKGTHVLGMDMVSGSMLIGEMRFSGYQAPESYEETLSRYAAEKEAQGKDRLHFEAESENILYKNSNVIRMTSTGNPCVSPHKAGEKVMNVIGGAMWQDGDTCVTWKIDVESAGLYHLGFHCFQNYRDGLPSFRSVEIDGAVPFAEMRAYSFKNTKSWRTETLSDSDGNPYLFYLSKGEHRITLRCVQGPMREVLDIVRADSLRFSDLMQKIIMLTGQDPDVNYDYELERLIPNLLPELADITDRMRQLMTMLEQVSGFRVAMYYQLKDMISQVEAMASNPFIIPRRRGDLSNIMATYGTWLTSFRLQPLLLDFIEVLPPGEKATERRAGFFDKLWVSMVNFVNSFFKDYDSITGVDETVAVTGKLNVWVGRGTDWAQQIKDMADETFTPRSGIEAVVNILPAGQLSSGGTNALMLAVASGNTPDVCMASTVAEFAMRNVLLDLRGFADFEEVRKRFLPELFVPMTYQDGVYGLPETMGFAVMAYRKDILSRLGLSLPNTWDELYHNVIPVLSQNNMQVFTGNSLDMFLFQSGGRYYTDDLRNSALDRPEAYHAFKELCELFTLYGIPVSASFYNRFRTGEMPMGIIDFVTYMTIRGAAPELDGLWGVAPIPGHLEADGTINRAHSGSAGEQDMIMSGSKNPDAAWSFLKWWTGEPVQSQYGYEIEALHGMTARWNSANLEAFCNMPWPREDLSVIRQSFEAYRATPLVLGGYFSSRHVSNAFNRTVISGMNPRDSLELAVTEINRELRRRRESAGIR